MTSTALEAAVGVAPALRTEVRHTSAPEPGGCRWCGTAQRQHASRFAPSVGQHVFDAPTAAQRLARMRARRTSRP